MICILILRKEKHHDVQFNYKKIYFNILKSDIQEILALY